MVQTHILYVETNRNFQASLKKTLEDRHNSFNITLSESAEDALEKLHEENFQCVLSDYTLSDMDGTELLQKVRESHPELPFFLLMENNDASVQKTAIEHNVTDCFNKETLHPHLLENNIDAFTTNYTITQNKNKETLQQIDPEILQQIFEQVPASLYIKDTEGRHLFMSDYDTSPEEALGKTDLEIYPEEVAKESYKDDIKVIRTGEPIRNKEEYNEVTDKWTITSKVPWYGKNEEINGLIGVTRFITEQKEQEQDLEKKKKRLEQFASVVSHDLRNPLSVADGYMQIAKEETGSEHLEPAIEALDRMNTLINELLQLAKGETKEDERTNTTLYNLFSEAWSNVDTKAATYSIDGRNQQKPKLRSRQRNYTYNNNTTHPTLRSPLHSLQNQRTNTELPLLRSLKTHNKRNLHLTTTIQTFIRKLIPKNTHRRKY